ncbi:MAG: hypothetical protein IJU56_00655 [Clostridia bacterium]|nr:hypothetical protein [Clostridia bacterium]
MKRMVSAFLALLMLLSCCGALTAAAAPADENVCDCEHTPLIYIYGRQDIFDDPRAENRKVISGYDVDWLKKLLSESVRRNAAKLLRGSFDTFCNEIAAAFEEKYRDFACKDDGSLPDNASGVEWTWSPETMRDDHRYDNVYSYVYIYDARKDPFEIADDLHAYIECVRRVTGHRRVTVLSRCMGSEMALTYFEKYGWQDIDTFFTYSSAALGTTIFSELFSGKVKIDLAGINNFLDEKHRYDDPDAPPEDDGTVDPETKALLFTALELGQQLGALGLPSKLCDLLLKRLWDDVLPRVLKASFATSAGYWSMVAPQDFADAKAFLFKNDAAKYAKLIEKIDAYDLRVRRPMRELLTRMKNDGVKLCFLAKYGFQIIPFTSSVQEQSDDKITLTAQSFGATGAAYGETLSSRYIAARKRAGFGSSISPDRLIDASTAWFPETTWFVKNIRHNDFPGRIYELVLRMTRADRQLTVNDDPDFPQFMTYFWENDVEHWDPMTAENMHTEYTHPDRRTALQAFWEALKLWLKRFFDHR